MDVALATIMLGVVQKGFDRTTGCGIAEVVKLPIATCVSRAESTTVGTATFFANARAFVDDRFWQIVGIDNTFSVVGYVLAGAGHSRFLLE
jgi:hypothetical protein